MTKKSRLRQYEKPESKREEALPRLKWWHLALVAGLALVCYLQTAGYGLVWDDNIQIKDNDRIRSFANLGQAFKEQFWAFYGKWHYYRPMQTVSYMIGYAFGGLSPAPYHWLNIVLHILASLAGLWFGWELFQNSRIAFLGALLFAAHPMHTESVAWSGGITDIGCGLFFFIAAASWLRSQAAKRKSLWLACSSASFLMALLYKEMAATLPVLLIGLDLTRRGGIGLFSWRQRLLRWSPLALVSAIYLWMRMYALGSFAPTAKLMPIGFVDFVLTDVYFVGLYLAKLLLPVSHNAYRVFVPFSQLDATEWGLPIILLAIFVWTAWKVQARDLRLSFLAGWTVFTLLPVLSIGSVGKNVFCERYLYIPSLGLCLLLAAMAEYCLKKQAREYVPVAGVVVVVILTVLTIQRNPVWQDDRTLLTATLGISPDVTKRHQELGVFYLRKGDLPSALREFESALKSEEQIFIRSPENRYDALIGISTVHELAGRLDQAWAVASEARVLNPRRGEAYRILGTVRSAQRKDDEAAELLLQSVSLNPSDTTAQINLGSVLLFHKKPAAAEDHFRKALEYDPNSVPARLGLAVTLGQLGRRTEAIDLARKVATANPGNAQAQRLLQELESEAGEVR